MVQYSLEDEVREEVSAVAGVVPEAGIEGVMVTAIKIVIEGLAVTIIEEVVADTTDAMRDDKRHEHGHCSDFTTIRCLWGVLRGLEVYG